MLNTEEFYKALMERYSFDEEKIRQAAIRQAKQPAIQRFAKNYWKPAAGIAAAVAVTIGATAYASQGTSGSGVSIIVSPASALSASERLHEAELNYYKAASEESDLRNVYITFCTAISYNDMMLSLSAATDTDDIKISNVYLSDGTVLSETEASSESGKNIVAAKVCAPAGLYRSMQDLSLVYLAEMESAEINDDTFVPIEVIEDSDPLMGDITSTTANPVSTTQFSFSQTTPTPEWTEPQPDDTEDAEEADAPDMTTATDTTLPPAEYVDPDEDDDPDDQDEMTEAAETTDSAEETEDTSGAEAPAAETSAAPAAEVPVTEITETATVGLMTEIYTLNVPNALETVLIDNYAVVLTKTEAYVYTLGGIVKDNRPQKAEMSSPKIAYSDPKTIIVTGAGADGKRNLMLYINAAGGNVGLIDASPFIGDSEIGTIQYSVSAGKYFIKTVSSTGTYIYEFDVDGSLGVSFRPLAESPTAISLAGCMGDMLYYMASGDGGRYVLCGFDRSSGSTKEIAVFATACSIKSGSTFGSFALIPSDGSNTYIFDTASADLVAVDVDADTLLTTVKRNTFFRNSEGTFVISDGIISEYVGSDLTFSRKPISEFTVSDTSSDKITVIKDNKWRS